MSDLDEMQLLLLKGVISDLEPAQRVAVAAIAQQIRDLVASDELGPVALALVGAELAAS